MINEHKIVAEHLSDYITDMVNLDDEMIEYEKNNPVIKRIENLITSVISDTEYNWFTDQLKLTFTHAIGKHGVKSMQNIELYDALDRQDVRKIAVEYCKLQEKIGDYHSNFAKYLYEYTNDMLKFDEPNMAEACSNPHEEIWDRIRDCVNNETWYIWFNNIKWDTVMHAIGRNGFDKVNSVLYSNDVELDMELLVKELDQYIEDHHNA